MDIPNVIVALGKFVVIPICCTLVIITALNMSNEKRY